MPKIKLSALVSDMKGKAQGSVFARNKGGLYFRNNPSGGGKKTAKWAKARSAFSSLASQWRKLSYQQTTAWNEAVQDFPSTDAFGEVRIPSGYELFMRLNQPLFNLDRGIMLTPPIPQPQPYLGQLVAATVGNFLFTPQSVYAPYNCQGDDDDKSNSGQSNPPGQCGPENYEHLSQSINNLDGRIVDGISNFDTTVPFVFSSIFVFNENSIIMVDDDYMIPLSTMSSDPSRLEFFLISNNGVEWSFVVRFYHDLAEYVAYSVPFEISFNKPVRMTTCVSLLGFGTRFVLVDDKYLELESSSSYLSPTIVNYLSFDFIPKAPDKYPKTAIQHSFFQLGEVSIVDLSLIHLGYIAGNPYYLFDYSKVVNGKFLNYGSSLQSNTEVPPLYDDLKKSLPNKVINVKPWLITFSNGFLDPGSAMVVKSTSMGSSGRSGARSGYKRIAVKSGVNNRINQLGSEFLEQFGAVLNGSTIQVKTQILNYNSGQLSADTEINTVGLPYGLGPVVFPVQPSQIGEGLQLVEGVLLSDSFISDPVNPSVQKKPKFKAGTELATAVNR